MSNSTKRDINILGFSRVTRRVHENELGRALGINQVTRLAASSVATALGGFLLNSALFELPFFIYATVMTGNLYLYTRFFGIKEKKSSKTGPLPKGNSVSNFARVGRFLTATRFSVILLT